MAATEFKLGCDVIPDSALLARSITSTPAFIALRYVVLWIDEVSCVWR